ncbi:hypothetical protein KCU92_g3175, partial [Aureobasidium melanogenum]
MATDVLHLLSSITTIEVGLISPGCICSLASIDCTDALGITSTQFTALTDEQLRSHSRALMLRVHPDRNSGRGDVTVAGAAGRRYSYQVILDIFSLLNGRTTRASSDTIITTKAARTLVLNSAAAVSTGSAASNSSRGGGTPSKTPSTPSSAPRPGPFNPSKNSRNASSSDGSSQATPSSTGRPGSSYPFNSSRNASSRSFPVRGDQHSHVVEQDACTVQMSANTKSRVLMHS